MMLQSRGRATVEEKDIGQGQRVLDQIAIKKCLNFRRFPFKYVIGVLITMHVHTSKQQWKKFFDTPGD